MRATGSSNLRWIAAGMLAALGVSIAPALATAAPPPADSPAEIGLGDPGGPEWDAIGAAAEAAAARVAAAQAARDAASGAVPQSRPPVTPESGPSTPGGFTRPPVSGDVAIEVVVGRALSQLGIHYAWGGGGQQGPTLGIRDGGAGDRHGDFQKYGYDCSGLMMYAFADAGIELPHYSGQQYTAGPQVPVEQRRRGDMLFWGPGGSEHVALYLGDGKMIEAPNSGDVVKISPVRLGGIMPYAVRMIE